VLADVVVVAPHVREGDPGPVLLRIGLELAPDAVEPLPLERNPGAETIARDAEVRIAGAQVAALLALALRRRLADGRARMILAHGGVGPDAIAELDRVSDLEHEVDVLGVAMVDDPLDHLLERLPRRRLMAALGHQVLGVSEQDDRAVRRRGLRRSGTSRGEDRRREGEARDHGHTMDERHAGLPRTTQKMAWAVTVIDSGDIGVPSASATDRTVTPIICGVSGSWPSSSSNTSQIESPIELNHPKPASSVTAPIRAVPSPSSSSHASPLRSASPGTASTRSIVSWGYVTSRSSAPIRQPWQDCTLRTTAGCGTTCGRSASIS